VRNVYNIFFRRFQRDLGGPGVDGRIILSWVQKKQRIAGPCEHVFNFRVA
jgi:hypothetical protein